MDLVKEFIERGYAIKTNEDNYQLTEKGRKALVEMIQSNPEFYKTQFPEWVHSVH